VEKNDGVHLYRQGEKVSLALSPADVMSYPA